MVALGLQVDLNLPLLPSIQLAMAQAYEMPTDELDAMADDILETAGKWGTMSYTKEMITKILELAR